MIDALLYLIQASGILAVLYSLYLLLLRKQTYFTLNRFYLIGIILASFLLPLASSNWLPSGGKLVQSPIENFNTVRESIMLSIDDWEFIENQAGPINQIGSTESASNNRPVGPMAITIIALLIAYGVGLIIGLIRLILLIRKLFLMKRSYSSVVIKGIRVVLLPFKSSPFSFLNNVYAHSDDIQKDDFQKILLHEKIHIKQNHSIDLLIVQFIGAFQWFNPVVRWLMKSLKITHEYIADRKMIVQGYSLVEYQTLLLSQLISNNSYGLVHYFNLSFTKKRITMMNIKNSGWKGLAKSALVLCFGICFGLLTMQCNSEMESQVEGEEAEKLYEELPVVEELPINYTVFYGHNDQTIGNGMVELEVVNLDIVDHQIYFQGVIYAPDVLANLLIEKKLSNQTVVDARIDKSQPMKLVEEVFAAFRGADLRKFNFYGEAENGEVRYLKMLLPPAGHEEKWSKMITPDTRQWKLDMTAGSKDLDFDDLDAFINYHAEEETKNFVVQVIYNDSNTFGQFSRNYLSAKSAFYYYYNKKAKELFDKKYDDLDQDEKGAVRKGLPMNITVRCFNE